MPPDVPPTTRVPAASLRRWLLSLPLVALAACGGGTGVPLEEPALPPPDGIRGTVQAPDRVLGRLAEMEPNGTPTLAYRLPPASARTRLEVAGNLGATAALYGQSDTADVLRYLPLSASDVTVRVTFAPVDPVGGGPNVLALSARLENGQLLAQAGGSSPQTLTVTLAARQPLLVTLAITQGHGPYLLTLEAADPAVPPKPDAPAEDEGPAGTRLEGAGAAARSRAACADTHVLVRLRPGTDPAAFAAAHGLTLGAPTGSGTWRMLLAPDAGGGGAQKAKRSAATLRDDPEVLLAEPDWIVQPFGSTNDPNLGRQWNLSAIGAPEAWDITRGAPSIVIGIVDSGFAAHPDLAGQTEEGYDFISDPTRAGDGDGRDADPTDAGDAGLSDGFSTWHGTHVGAIAAGRADDGVGGAGVAPGCRVMALRALGRGGGLSSDVADAILFAAGALTTAEGRRLAAPLRIVNLSLGTPVPSSEIESACAVAAERGVLLVAAAGNDGGSVAFPAAYPTVMAVGAVDGLLDGAAYSNHGNEVSVVAPGGRRTLDLQGDGWPDAVLSAGVDETQFPRAMGSTWYVGTSQASPHVAGAAALLLSLSPTLTRTQVKARLEQSAMDRGVGGFDVLHGHGLLQVHTALKRLRADLGSPLVTPALSLPVRALRFTGLETQRSVPVVNAGGGVLTIQGAQVVTDDGGNWLGVTLVPNFLGADCDVARIEVLVDRTALPPDAGWWSGTIRLYNTSGALGLLRVTTSVNTWARAGTPFRVVALDAATGGSPLIAFADPERDYRYWLTGLPVGTYRIKSGDDLDADGFFCEPGDLCGWFGGATEAEATLLPFEPGAGFPGSDVTLR